MTWWCVMRTKYKYRPSFVFLVWLFLLLSSCTTPCYSIAEQQSPAFPGNLLFVKGNTIYLFSSTSNETYPIANLTDAHDLHVSPNCRYLVMAKVRDATWAELPEDAVFEFEHAAGATTTHYVESLELIEMESNIVTNIKVPDTLRRYSLKGWFDNEWLLFEPVFGTIEQGFLGWPVIDANQPTGSIFLFSPFTGEIISVVPHLPADLAPDFLVLPRWWLYPFTYHPDKQKVFLYTHNEKVSKYVLWDVTNGQVIWEKALNPAEVGDPARWSPDGKYIAYYNKGNLFLVEVQGVEKTIPLPSTKYVQAQSFAWSPTSSYLAFWVGDISKKNDLIQPFELVVYNTKNNEIINTCIVSELGVISWLPDGEQIIVLEENSRHIWLNIQEKRAVRFSFDQGNIIRWTK